MMDTPTIIDQLMRLFGTLVFLFQLFFVGVRSDMTQGVPPPQMMTPTPTAVQESGDMQRLPILIDNVTVQQATATQITLAVEGTIQDGCQFPVIVAQSVNADSATVEIYRELPTDVMCPMMIAEYSDQIQIHGNFSAGTVVINVNDQTVNVTIDN